MRYLGPGTNIWGLPHQGQFPNPIETAPSPAHAYGVMTPARMARSASTLAQLTYVMTPGSGASSLTEIQLPGWVSKPPKKTGDAYFQTAYWLAVAVQLATGRGQSWTTLYREAMDNYRMGNIVGAGSDQDDRREEILRQGAELAVENNIPEAAIALTQLAGKVRDQKRGGSWLGWILAGTGAIAAGYLIFVVKKTARRRRR